MKTKSILCSLLFAATAFALLSNCSGNKNESTTASHEHDGMDSTTHEATSTSMEASKPQFTVDATFQHQLAEVFTAYISLKEAFVSSDVNNVKTEASTTSQLLSKTDMKLLSGEAHTNWMNDLSGLESSLKSIQATDNLEEQRQAFSDLSASLYKSIKAFGLDGASAYYEFCPMALHNQGAFWLSKEEKIRNPYFGDKMLTCGVVKEKLQ